MVENKDSAPAKQNWLSGFLSNIRMLDGWANVFTGLGRREKDAREHSTVEWVHHNQDQLESFYAGDAIAEKVVELPVEEATKKGYELTGITPEQAKALRDRMKVLGFDQAIRKACIKARLYGGAAILRGYDDALDLKKPLPFRDPFVERAVTGTNVGTGLDQPLPEADPNAPKPVPVKRPPLKSLLVFHRFEIPVYWQDVDKDILSPNFDTPIYYTFVGRGTADSSISNVKIHRSRLTVFEGKWLPDRLRRTNLYWGDSVLGKLWIAIRNYAFAHDSVNAALKDLSVAVFKIKDLAGLIGSGQEDNVTKRLHYINMSKSIARAVVLDAEAEEFEFKNRTLTGAADLVDRSEGRLAAEANIPRTVLFGESPAGGLGKGESGGHETDNWHAFVVSYQTNYLKPPALEILREICDELSIPSEKLDIQFHPLSEMSITEKAAAQYQQAQTDQIYITNGALDASEVRESRFGDDEYSFETHIDPEITPDDLASEMEKKAMLQNEAMLAKQKNSKPSAKP